MKTILGLYRPREGTIVFDGKDLNEVGREGLRWYRSRVGYVQQDPYGALAPFLTVERILEEPLIVNGVKSKPEREQRVRKVMEEVKLFPVEDFLSKFPHMLSGGQQQRVAIARALINRPAIVLADEPTGNLDSKSGEEIMAILVDLWKGGRTIVMVTHNDHIAACSERVIRLFDGQVINGVGPN